MRATEQQPDPTAGAPAALVETFPLSMHATGPRRMREQLRKILAVWGLKALIADAEQVAAELVNNVVVHGAGPARFWMYVDAGRLVIEVTDSSPLMPEPRTAADDDEDGRGYTIITALAAAWGVEMMRGTRRKKVWASLIIEPGMLTRKADGCACGFVDDGYVGDGRDPATVVFERIMA